MAGTLAAGTPVNDTEPSSPVLPPWLWVYVVADVVSGVPSQDHLLQSALTSYQRHASVPARPAPYLLLILIAFVAGLPNAVLALGVAACLFPKWRGRRVERRLGPRRAGPSWPRCRNSWTTSVIPSNCEAPSGVMK